LEFPVVILAMAGRSFNLRDSQNDLLLHEARGMAGKVILPELRVRYAGAYHMLVAADIRRELLAEEQRLLYVALTRAEQRVIVVSADRRGEQRFQAWREEEYGATGRGSGSAASFMDWLGPAVLGFRGESQWVGKLWEAEQTFAPAEKRREENRLWQAVATSPDIGGEGGEWDYIGRQLEWRYAWRQAGELSAKLSVTQARGRLYPTEDTEAAKAPFIEAQGLYAPRREGPRFLRTDKSLPPGEKGTLLHKILARLQPAEAARAMGGLMGEGLDAAGAASAYLDSFLDKLAAAEFMASDEAGQADKGMLAPFLLSPLFRRMALADARGDYRQEASFFMSVPAGRVYQEMRGDGADDQVVLQGIIDAFFVEGDGLVLVDYKSDRVEPGREADLLRRYKGQLLLYAEGLEAFIGRKVTEMMLYSLTLGKEIPLGTTMKEGLE
jgi:ATP-dependent helicase/nuclease subunit A